MENQPPPIGPINVGEDNPSFGNVLENSFAWDNSHSPETREKWSQDRGKYHFWLYSANDLGFIQYFASGQKLCDYLNVSASFTGIILNLISKAGSTGIVYGEVIIITLDVESDYLKSVVGSLPIKPLVKSRT